ncbi:hypothetical protein BKA69DRAFT_1077223 [Paraphysoderma sedebokerense]|nr:hypothetical protein BKA69DRAFT_1077223 [Paraphysoderma sedebokerense]
MSIPSSDHDSAVHHKTRGQEDPCFNVCIIVTAIILPPFSVFCVKGCGKDFAINLVLTILGLIPGMIHAIYIFIKNPDETFGKFKDVTSMNQVLIRHSFAALLILIGNGLIFQSNCVTLNRRLAEGIERNGRGHVGRNRAGVSDSSTKECCVSDGKTDANRPNES